MTAKEIAEKYVHGKHDALTDSQEKKDMANDIEQYANEKVKEVLSEIQSEGENAERLLDRIEEIRNTLP